MSTQNTAPYIASRKNLERMKRIVSLLKQKNCTKKDILKDLEQIPYYANPVPISCSERTFRQDISILKTDYKCPIEFDRSIKKYVLYNKNWNFPLPPIVNQQKLLALAIGEKFARDILSPGVARCVTEAVQAIILGNEAEGFISAERLGSLKILSSRGVHLADDIFVPVFDAWRSCHCLQIDYRSSKHRKKYFIEPHAMIFHDMQWGIRAFCPEDQEWRTFLVNRVESASVETRKFKPNQKVISQISSDNYFGFPSAGPVTIQLNSRGAEFARIHQLRSTQQLSRNRQKKFQLSVPDVSQEEMLQWILSHVPGDAYPIAPAQMVQAFRKALQSILDELPT